MKKRCSWCSNDDIYRRYHDDEWGVPVYDDRGLFEFLILESAQAGLSWITILKRREGYRESFYDFDVEKVSKMSNADVERLMRYEGIVRHRGKIESAINNAKKFIEIQKEFGSFSKYIWSYVDNTPLLNSSTGGDIVTETPLSKEISKDLKKRGFKFVGPTIIYAYMQAMGIVDDHEVGCYKYKRS